MNQKKILNDPVYGFISIPSETIYRIMEHPYFQRLRRIKQVGLTHYVYPGALHTRFHHALGAMHLMQEALNVLRSKGVDISNEEYESALIAILLHDVGHGPYSHALEHMLIDVHHETLTLQLMELLNAEFRGKLDMAIQIFRGTYPRKFLNQLVSSQLDVDRMDYLKRDSFFTGVAEGVIGHDRIIKMLSVYSGNLVVEEKGIYSIEKYLMARRLMYWQVYLHKTVLSAELMLQGLVRRARFLASKGHPFEMTTHLRYFLEQEIGDRELEAKPDEVISHFARLDDIDIGLLIKSASASQDFVLNFLGTGLHDRKLFKCELMDEPAAEGRVRDITWRLVDSYGVPESEAGELVLTGTETTESYSEEDFEIQILKKDGGVEPLSVVLPHTTYKKVFMKYYLCYPKPAFREFQ